MGALKAHDGVGDSIRNETGIGFSFEWSGSRAGAGANVAGVGRADGCLQQADQLDCRGITQMSTGVSVSVDLGIGECIRVIDSINGRRAKRKEDFLADLCDDLDAVEQVVKTLDDLFIALVGGFADASIVDDSALLKAHMEQTMVYFRSRNLLPILEDLRGRISGSAYDRRLKHRRYRDLVSTLRALEKRLDSYREELGKGSMTFVGQANELNLMSLWEKADDDSLYGDITLIELAEEVFRNHDFDLSDSIHRLAGGAKAHAKSANL